MSTSPPKIKNIRFAYSCVNFFFLAPVDTSEIERETVKTVDKIDKVKKIKRWLRFLVMSSSRKSL